PSIGTAYLFASRPAIAGALKQASGPVQAFPGRRRPENGQVAVPPTVGESCSAFDECGDLLECRAQVDVQLPIHAEGSVVEGVCARVEFGPLGQTNGGVAGLGHAGEGAGTDLGEQGDAKRRPLGGVDRVDVLAVDVGLDLAPERVSGAAAGE